MAVGKHALVGLMSAGAIGASIMAATPAQAAPAQAAAAPASVTQARDVFPGYVWATNVNLRYSRLGNTCNNYPSVGNCETVSRQVSQQKVGIYCQKRGQPIYASGYYSEWWSYISGGEFRPATWISNVYLSGDAHLAGIPDCNW